jgi:DNA-binding MarR family transcriptional regulator
MAKQLDRQDTSAPSPGQVAEAVLQTTLLVTRLVTPEVRRLRPKQLSLSQIRALDFLDGNPDAALMAVADYVGLAPPSTSALVDGLVRRGLVARLAAPDDRRRLRLRLTGAGRGALRTALAASQAVLAARFGALSPRERALVARALARLRPFVTRGRGPRPRGR